jgi:hypothetical protein
LSRGAGGRLGVGYKVTPPRGTPPRGGVGEGLGGAYGDPCPSPWGAPLGGPWATPLIALMSCSLTSSKGQTPSTGTTRAASAYPSRSRLLLVPTYALSGLLLAVAYFFAIGVLSATGQTIAWMVIFFFASVIDEGAAQRNGG